MNLRYYFLRYYFFDAMLFILQLSRGCSFEVQRVMRQRAVSVDLEPRIEDACLKDLGLFCSDKLEKGEVGITDFPLFVTYSAKFRLNCAFG